MNQPASYSDREIIQQSRHWLKRVILRHDFCPFARYEFENNRIHFEVCNSTDMQYCLESVITECKRLDENKNIATTLIIFSKKFADFESFLELVDMANALLRMQDYEGIYQLAHFHPDYMFAGEDSGDAANFTNRSPWPMLHLLREVDIEQAIAHYEDVNRIPARNIERARQLGREYFATILAKIRTEK